MSPEQVKSLSTPDLVALYNRLTGKSIKGFHTRSKGEQQVLAELAKQPKAAPPSEAKPKASVRTVNGSASAGKTGRPRASFIVVLTEEKGTSKPQKNSVRSQLMEWLRGREPFQFKGERLIRAARIEDAEAHFRRPLRGVVQKLIEKSWVKRIEVTAA